MPTHYRGAPAEVAALDAYIKLMRAAESVTARLEPSMAAAGLTVGQFGALEALLHLGRQHHRGGRQSRPARTGAPVPPAR